MYLLKDCFDNNILTPLKKIYFSLLASLNVCASSYSGFHLTNKHFFIPCQEIRTGEDLFKPS